MSKQYPYYTVNGREFTTYQEANYYWLARGGVLMETLDRFTPAHMLQSKPIEKR